MDNVKLAKYKLNLDYCKEVDFWMSELVTVLEELFPGQFSALNEDGDLQALITRHEMMDHLIKNVSTNKEKGKNYVKLLGETMANTYKPEAVGLANFFAKQHKFQRAVNELGYKLLVYTIDNVYLQYIFVQ